MARVATVLAHIEDLWDDWWAVRERRPTGMKFSVHLGWPAGESRGKGGAGGPRVIVTKTLADYFEQHRFAPSAMQLPIGAGAIKRVRRLLGHHRQIDAAAWWDERVEDLNDLTVEAFVARHGCSAGAVVNARHAYFGRVLRPAGWWREPDVAVLISGGRSRAEIADDLGISVGALGRLRWALKT